MNSVITIESDRGDRLANTLWGLEQNTKQPKEWVIVHMTKSDLKITSDKFPVKQVFLPESAKELPLAAARNLGARTATGRHLIFLDVDCIPEKNFVSSYDTTLKSQACLASGRVKFLPQVIKNPKKADPLRSYDLLRQIAEDRSSRQPLAKGLADEQRHSSLHWSLNFAATRRCFEKIGGFDDAYKGFGGDEVDFEMQAKQKGIAVLKNNDPTVYHQFHESYEPPVHYLKSIVSNANYFFSKWQVWPFEDYLREFEKLDLIQRYPGRILINDLSYRAMAR